MSQVCRSNNNHFVGITMYSPNYRSKAERLLRSCARVGVCCKATLLPPLPYPYPNPSPYPNPNPSPNPNPKPSPTPNPNP